MDSILDDIEGLLKLKIGDIARLEHIKKTLESKKTLYDSDREYVETLTQKIRTHQVPQEPTIQKKNETFEEHIDDCTEEHTSETDKLRCELVEIEKRREFDRKIDRLKKSSAATTKMAHVKWLTDEGNHD